MSVTDYRIVYGPRAERVLAVISADRRQVVRQTIERWARNPPASGRHTEHRVDFAGGYARCRVEHVNELINVVTVVSLSC